MFSSDNDIQTTKFELHYYFNDNSHSMNAFKRNRCEHELLRIINEISVLLDIKVNIETQTFEEGGLREIWSVFVENSPGIIAIVAIIQLILKVYPIKNNEELDLKKEMIQLEIEDKKIDHRERDIDIHERKHNLEIRKHNLEIRKQNYEEKKHLFEERGNNLKNLKYELSKFRKTKNNITVENTINNIKITKFKSNFYKELITYNKVTKISTSLLNDQNVKIGKEYKVSKKEFSAFILKTDKLDAEDDENATINIVSPVLKSGKYTWKGLYNNELINFHMTDPSFKNSVIEEGLPFKNGTFIICILRKFRKIDTNGAIIISKYSVIRVNKISDGIKTVETNQGKKFRKNQLNEQNQLRLFEDED